MLHGLWSSMEANNGWHPQYSVSVVTRQRYERHWNIVNAGVLLHLAILRPLT